MSHTHTLTAAKPAVTWLPDTRKSGFTAAPPSLPRRERDQQTVLFLSIYLAWSDAGLSLATSLACLTLLPPKQLIPEETLSDHLTLSFLRCHTILQ